MLAPETRFRVQVADVAAKVIDGEAIIMNLSNGLYFSMDKVGAAVWELMENGHSIGEMTDTLGGHFGADPQTVRGDLVRLLEELLAEGLIHEGDATFEGAIEFSADPGPYSAPVLNKYSDMADLLALDPPMPGLGDTPVPE